MKSLTLNGKLSLLSVILSVCLMIPGWFMPLVSIRASIDAPFVGSVEVLNETRSMYGTILNLFLNNNIYPALLILFFGMIIPSVKVLATLAAIAGSGKSAVFSARLVHLTSKWAMSDVFAISVLVAFMTGNALKHTTAELHTGFYLFSAYCLFSILSSYFLKLSENNRILS